MRLLFDENMPYALAKALVGHECLSVVRLGWQGTKNGHLLRRAEEDGFDVLITLDDNIAGEQNMAGRRLSILVLKPAGQGRQAVVRLAEGVVESLRQIRPGEIRVIGLGDT